MYTRYAIVSRPRISLFPDSLCTRCGPERDCSERSSPSTVYTSRALRCDVCLSYLLFLLISSEFLVVVVARNTSVFAVPSDGAKSKRGLTLTQILNHRRTETECGQTLLKARWRDGRGCPRCEPARFCRLSSCPASLRSNHCKRQLSRLAGTLLQTIVLPLTT